MRNFVMRRGAGKTTRMIAASEFNRAPIICLDEGRKRHILDAARRYDYRIPSPITVNELLSGKFYGNFTYKDFLVDESQDVLVAMIASLTRAGDNCVIGMTTTDPRSA